VPKPKTAIISLTCCEGCQLSILDLGEKLLDIAEKLDLRSFRLASGTKNFPGPYDIAIVEGCPVTKDNFEKLLEIRKQSKVLIALGACAHLGGVAEIKNYKGNKDEQIKYVYKNFEKIDNPDIKAVGEVVPIDAFIPGCPINNKEFYRIVMEFAEGKKPSIAQRPVCYECHLRKNKCLLQEGKPCFGPVTLGGCEAICPSNGFICEACRGPLKGTSIEKLREIVKDKMSNEDLMKISEIYGVKDKFENENVKPQN